MSKKNYEMITNQIIEKLEKGTVPWKKPFKNGVSVNWKTQKRTEVSIPCCYGGEYATFKQIKEAGGKVKKGEKSHIVVFWKMIEVEDQETDQEKKIPLLRYFRVFEVCSQVEGIEPK
ncbi:ArdC-like ssDNA-binding domain-containing protein [Halobacillus seohaensis]|uniref:ArdC-like ssDNA-binding domain-containing protein n=1 Tax=Halobacillus seohaensis TaxID=447421 RepID=A0ABW2EML0_9BACI